MRLLTCDIDLRRCHLYDATDEELLCLDATPVELVQAIMQRARGSDITLAVEVAGVIMHGPQQSHMQRRMAWSLYNIAVVARLAQFAEAMDSVTMLVATSTKWTKGFTEVRRHKMSGAEDEQGFTKAQNHDIKEMKAMAWFFRRDPSAWVPFGRYLECL